MAAHLEGLEQALVDVVRLSLSGDSDGVRQLSRRFARRPPEGSTHHQELKDALFALLESTPQPATSPLRGQVNSEDASWVRYPSGVSEPVVSPQLHDVIELIVSEHLAPERLHAFGLMPSRAVLFTGPPGVGKTLAAGYIASRLSLPLITLNLASLMSSLMGQTGRNLQDLLARAAQEPSVLFLDEFDALAKSRVDASDVGEVKRLVNVVLQQLDQWPAGGLLLAATNHPQLLDPAVHRRFDTVVEFELPGFDERLRFLTRSSIAALRDADEGALRIVALISEGWSLAELDSWVHRTARAAVLKQSEGPVHIVEEMLRSAQKRARDWSAGSADLKAELAVLAAEELRWTHRRIADWLGVSHVTIGKYVKRSRGGSDE